MNQSGKQSTIRHGSGNRVARPADARRDRGRARPGRLAVLAASTLVLVGTGAGPAAAGMGGIYDFMVQTNCLRLPEQSDLRTPYWSHQRVPLFAPGQARLYARTIRDTDRVTFVSDRPNVIPPLGPVQLIGEVGGIPYQQTMATLALSDPGLTRPVDVRIVANSGNRSDRALSKIDLGNHGTDREFRVFPRMHIERVEVLPRKPVYEPGEQITLNLRLPWSTPISTVRAQFGQPTARIGGSEVAAGYPEWNGAAVVERIQTPETRQIRHGFRLTWPQGPAFASLGNASVQLRLDIALKTVSRATCDLTKAPNTARVVLTMKNPNAGATLVSQPVRTKPGGSARDAVRLQRTDGKLRIRKSD